MNKDFYAMMGGSFLSKLIPLGVVGGVLLTVTLRAQDVNFSMYHNAPLYTNPGMMGTVADVRVMVNYRNQRVSLDENFRSSSVSLFYPVAIGAHRLAMGGGFLNDKAAGFLTTNGGLLGAAFRLQATPDVAVSLGLQGGYYQRQADGGFSTDDQYVGGVYNPGIPSADAVLSGRKGYPVVSGGLHVTLSDDRDEEKAFAGVAIYNGNRPDVRIVDTQQGKDRLSPTLKGTVGYRLIRTMYFSVMPTARWVYHAGDHFYNLGATADYIVSATAEGFRKISAGAWYHTHSLGVFSLAYREPAFSLAASYDVPLNTELATAQSGVVEIALSLRLQKKSHSPGGGKVSALYRQGKLYTKKRRDLRRRRRK